MGIASGNNVVGAVDRAVVHHDYFQLLTWVVQAAHRLEAFEQKADVVVSGDDNRDGGRIDSSRWSVAGSRLFLVLASRHAGTPLNSRPIINAPGAGRPSS